MKDWLSALLKVDSTVRAQTCRPVNAGFSAASVLEAYGPLLKALAQAMDSSVESVVADALFRHLSDKADVIAEDSEALAALSVDTSDFVSPKSGRLDKVGDDCLKLALCYLSTSDRCAAEYSCKRLFHLSRALALECEDFQEMSRKCGESSIRVASRFSQRRLSDILWHFGVGIDTSVAMERMRKSVAYLRKSTKEVRFNNWVRSAQTTFLFDVHFPKLTHLTIVTFDAVTSLRFVPFLQRHSAALSTLHWEATFLNDADAAIFDCLAQMPSLRTLELKMRGVALSFDISPLCDLRQIESVKLKTHLESGLEWFRPLLHERVTQLKVSGPFHCCALRRMPRVRSLRLGISKLQNWQCVLDALSSDTLERIDSRGSLSALPQLLAETKRFAADLQFAVRSYSYPRTEIDAKSIVDEMQASDSGTALKHLTLLMYEEYHHRDRDPAIAQFLTCLNAMQSLPPLSLKIEDKWWQIAKAKMHHSAVADLLPNVAFFSSRF